MENTFSNIIIQIYRNAQYHVSPKLVKISRRIWNFSNFPPHRKGISSNGSTMPLRDEHIEYIRSSGVVGGMQLQPGMQYDVPSGRCVRCKISNYVCALRSTVRSLPTEPRTPVYLHVYMCFFSSCSCPRQCCVNGFIWNQSTAASGWCLPALHPVNIDGLQTPCIIPTENFAEAQISIRVCFGRFRFCD